MKAAANFAIIFILLGSVLLAGCSGDTRSAVETNVAQPAPSSPPAPTEPVPTITARPAEDRGPSTVVADQAVSEGDGINHELVFAIRNPGRYSGENGQPAWLGWGATAFAVAPDGSFWIADTPADPDRLLHYSPRGDLLAAVPMLFDQRQYWAPELFADASGVWVLDTVSQPGVVLHLDSYGALLGEYAIPEVFASYRQEEFTMPGLWSIVFADGDRVLLQGPVGIVELTASGSQALFQQVDGYPIGGHLYTEVADGLTIDGQLVPVGVVQPGHFRNYHRLLGVAEDGSIYIEEGEGNLDQGKVEPPDEFVRRYDASGELVGIALLALAEAYDRPDVALGPDGSVYALYSYTDHSVEIHRLVFYTGAPPLVAPGRVLLKTYFSPLLPAGTAPATDMDAAREVMLAFFVSLAAQKYEEAAMLYGGSYEEAIAQGVVSESDTPGIAWQNICQSEFCMPVSDILDSRQTGLEQVEFLVGFVHENGFRFDDGVCCGYFRPPPTAAWFVYSVTVEKVDGQWKVMGAPVPLP